MRDRLLQRGGVGTCVLRGGGGGGRQTFLQGMTGIKEDEEVCVCLTVCVCQWEEGREGCVCVEGGCLSVLVDRAGDCSQIQLIPSGCIHLSRTSDGKKRQGGKKRGRETPKVQYLVCINLCLIPQETLVIISISPRVKGEGSFPACL